MNVLPVLQPALADLQDSFPGRFTAVRAPCPFGDGKAARRIVSILERGFERRSLAVESSSFVGAGSHYPEFELVSAAKHAGKTIAAFERCEKCEANVLFEGARGAARYPNPERKLKKTDFLLVKR